ncbi:MAG TPA: hypothetical protein VE130_03670 [Nitrososphaeraceae archaeon]|nr:hypothetical protein [Nitrososphaeraceae archaeon]
MDRLSVKGVILSRQVTLVLTCYSWTAPSFTTLEKICNGKIFPPIIAHNPPAKISRNDGTASAGVTELLPVSPKLATNIMEAE